MTMLTRIYIEALLVDEILADHVWEAWHSGDIDDSGALLAWQCILAAYLEGFTRGNEKER